MILPQAGPDIWVCHLRYKSCVAVIGEVSMRVKIMALLASCLMLGVLQVSLCAYDPNNEEYYKTHPSSPYESFSQLPPDEPDQTYNDSNSYGPNYYYQPPPQNQQQ